MKNIFFGLLAVFFFSNLLAQTLPENDKTEFSTEALNQRIQDTDGKVTTVGDIFGKHKGKVIVLDIWATWCPDCITGFPELKKIQKKYPEAVYLFFSLDRIGKEEVWKNGIEKYELSGEHYWFNTDWKNDFDNFIDLNWIPRYMVIDQTGKIAHYYSIHADDPRMIQMLEKTLKN